MTIRTDAAPAAIQSVLTDAERHQLLSRANYPHLQEDPGAYLVKITEDMVRSKLLAAMPTGDAHAVPPHQWHTTVAQMKVLAAELSRAAEIMGGDDEESRDVDLILAVAPAGTVQDDDNVVNDTPVLTVRLAEYPEEGVYPVDPHDPTGGRTDDPALPASAQDVAKSAAQIARWKRDSELLMAIQDSCWDVRFLSHSNGDDCDISIEIIGHYMDAPYERVMGENHSENLRNALEQALTADAYPPARPEYDEYGRPVIRAASQQQEG